MENLAVEARKADIDAAARKHCRKGRTKRAAVEAARRAHTAIHEGFPDWRRKRRNAMRRAVEAALRETDRGSNGRVIAIAARGERWPQVASGGALAAPRTTRKLAEQLDEDRRHDLRRAFDTFANGSIPVHWVDSLDDCGVAVDSALDWDGYSKSTRYPMKLWTVRVRALRMQRADLPGGERVVDGLVTLGAEGIPSPDGETRAWRAVWAVKRRGVDWDIAQGIMVQHGEDVVHGRDLRTAMRTLRARRTTAQREALYRQGIDRATALAEHGDKRINWRIARRAGLCADGICAWVARHFPELNPRRDSITVRQALDTRDSESLVLAAVVRLARG